MTTPTLSERPNCWAFAMDFLGDPEAPIVEAYVAALEAENAWLLQDREAMARDAERYRWLADDQDGNAQGDFIQWLCTFVVSRKEIDVKIDAAMRGQP